MKKKPVFIDSAEKAKWRDTERQRLLEVKEAQDRQTRIEEKLRLENRYKGQLTLGEIGQATIHQFIKKKKGR